QDAGGHRPGTDEEEGREDERPEVGSSGHAVAHQHLKHQQQQVEAHGSQRGLELHTRLPVLPVERHHA
ncbi:hypothetical protein NHX12_021359, partial [Muraenolepis orangiensis]